MVQLAPELIQREVRFEDRPRGGVVVKAVTGPETKEAGVKEGDTVVALGGRALRRRHEAKDVEDIVAGLDDGSVDVLLWGLRGVKARTCGAELAVYCKDSSGLDPLNLGEIRPPACLGVQRGTVVVVLDGGASKLRKLRDQGIERGDLLIGVNYEPIKDDEPPNVVEKRLEDHLLLGPVILNLWRCSDHQGHADLQKKALRAARVEVSKRGGLQGTAAKLQLQTDACVDACSTGCGFESNDAPVDPDFIFGGAQGQQEGPYAASFSATSAMMRKKKKKKKRSNSSSSSAQ